MASILTSRMARSCVWRWQIVSPFPLPMRSCSSCMTVGEARHEWTREAVCQMSKTLGRDLYTLQDEPISVGDVFAKSCRIVGTDQYIPCNQVVAVNREIVMRVNVMTSDTVRFHNRFRLEHEDRASGSTVDFSWEKMEERFNNLVRVADIQQMLPQTDLRTYGLDLIRAHLLMQQAHSKSAESFYFTAAEFCKYKIIKLYLTSSKCNKFIITF